MGTDKQKDGINEIDGFLKSLGAMIKEIRKSRGMTQKQLAEKVGIDRPNISRIEIGNQNPSMKTLCKIIYGLDCFIDIEVQPIELDHPS